MKFLVIISAREAETKANVLEVALSNYILIRSVSKVACWECGRMVDSVVAVYSANGFHHCPPETCRGYKLVDGRSVGGTKGISPEALIFSVKKDTS